LLNAGVEPVWDGQEQTNQTGDPDQDPFPRFKLQHWADLLDI
jgi:hypothetical protein